MVFGRKKRDKQADAGEEVAEAGVLAGDDAAGDESGDATGDVAERPRAAAPDVAATSGPWDIADLPEGDEVARIDLGGMRVPLPGNGEVRLEVAPNGQVMSAIALDAPRGQVQINVFAAPRLEGIWDDVRLEIAQSLRAQGGTAEETDGPFGRELKARIPNPDQPGQTVPARFLGYDGPRWFLRGLITGPAATDPTQAATLYDVFRNVVVIRGKDAMAPRDPLPLTLPKEAQEAAEQAAEAQRQEQERVANNGEQRDWQSLDPFERGPEITETR